MSNSYYNHGSYPAPNAPGSSASLRAELQLITGGFNKLPTLAGNAYKVAMVDPTAQTLVVSAALQALAITSSTLDSTPIGATTRAAGNFTNLSVNGTAGLGTAVTIGGGTINSTPIGGITPAAGAFTTLSASSGITGNLTGNLTGNVTGNVTGNAGTVTNGVYTSGSYSNPAWIASLAGSKISGDISGNAGTVTNGVYTSGSYSDPAWLTSLAGSKVTGNIAGNSAGISGVLPIASGGTGLSTTPTSGQIDIGNGANFTRATLTAGSGISITNGSGSITIAATGSGSGTVTSVDASGGATGLSFSGGPVTASGTLTLAGTLAVASGGTGLTATPTSGQLDIGNGTGFTRTTLTAGSGVSISNAAGAITISATGSGGSVTSVNASGGTTGLTFSGGPVTTTGTLTVAGTLAVANGGTGQTDAQAAMNNFAGAVTSGLFLRGNGTNVVMAAIQAGDVPTLDQSTTGNAATATALQTARLINGVSFNGTVDITIPATPTLNVVTTTTQTAVKDTHYVLTNVAATTVTLPATPAAGDIIWVTVGNGLTTNIVARNGSNIQSIAEDLTLNAPYAAVQMRYINSTIGWTFV